MTGLNLEILFIIILVLLAFYFFWYPQLRRSENLRKIAIDLNIPFYPKGDDSLYDHLEYFHLFSMNSKSRITNMLHQEDEETELAFFDFTFEIGGGGSRDHGISYATRYQQSVVYFCSHKLDLPQFVLQPEKNFINLATCKTLIFPVTQSFQMIIYFKGIQRNRYVICLMKDY